MPPSTTPINATCNPHTPSHVYTHMHMYEIALDAHVSTAPVCIWRHSRVSFAVLCLRIMRLHYMDIHREVQSMTFGMHRNDFWYASKNTRANAPHTGTDERSELPWPLFQQPKPIKQENNTGKCPQEASNSKYKASHE